MLETQLIGKGGNLQAVFKHLINVTWKKFWLKASLMEPKAVITMQHIWHMDMKTLVGVTAMSN